VSEADTHLVGLEVRGGTGNPCVRRSATCSCMPHRAWNNYGVFTSYVPRQGMASQAAEKILFAVILSEAKNLLVLCISTMPILRRLCLLRMTVSREFFSNLFSRAEMLFENQSTALP